MTARAAAIAPSDATDRGPRPRIAIAASGLGHVTRGIEAWAADLARALWRRGEDVVLFKGAGRAEEPYEEVIACWRRDSARARRAARVLPRSLAWRLGLQSVYAIEQQTFAWQLIRRLRAARIDILHVQDPLVALAVQRAHRLGLVPTRAILAHGTEEPAAFLRRLAYVQHLAPGHAQTCKAEGVWRPTWTTIPNFIDTDRFCPRARGGLRAELGIPADALVVLTVAAIKKAHKRIDCLLNEFARLRETDPNLPVWLVVAGGKETDTEELVALGRRTLGDRVRFLVRFPRERMAELYASADLFVLSSLVEMMPIALLEAAASGLPCVTNRHCVLEWILGPGGETIDMAAPTALSAALRSLLGNAERRRILGKLARDHCVSHFSEGVVVEQIMAYHRAVLSADPRAKMRTAELHAGRERPEPRVSVVIPAFNCGPWIAEAIQSALAQTIPPTEIIVVDDGSTDDTRHRLAPYLDRIRYVSQQNQGVAAARNRGIELASGDLIAFLDADDVWHPRKLEMQRRALVEHPAIGLLGTATYEWPGAAPAIDRPEGGPVVLPWRRLVVKNGFTTSSVVVRRELLEQVGMFNPALRGPEDYDLWLRIAERATVANLETRLVGYRSVPGSLGQQPATMEEGLKRILLGLDARGVWRSRWLLRCKAHSYTGYSCAYLYGAAGNQPMAFRKLLASLARYPLPYRGHDVRVHLARPRMMTTILRRWLAEVLERRPRAMPVEQP